MNRLITLIIALLMVSMMYGQITVQGTPPSFNNPQLQQDLPILVMPSFDIDAVVQAEQTRQTQAQKALPGRFGHKMKANITLQNSGLWELLPNGDRVWRMAIQSEKAFSLNLLLSDFFIPVGAELYLYNANKDYVFGAITAQNNKSHRQLSISPIPGEVTILEYYEPANVAGQGSILISDVVHAYKDLFKLMKKLQAPNQKLYGDSGACNIDVACSLGDNWQNQVKSVVIALINGNDWCTGTMVNNTLEDGTPYFLTADHCMDNTNPANLSFHFNFESPSCNGPTGSYAQSVSGATLKASAGSSDFALLELSTPPPPSYVVYYAGWDAAATMIDSTITIHHPSGDVKKISFNEDLLIDGVSQGTNYWRVTEWEMGTTEGGSSGCALFDKNGRIVGQLFGGQASCNNITWDEYGKFSASWDLNAQPNAQLKAWLDPQNTGLTQLDGAYFLTVPNYDVTLSQVTSPSSTAASCSQDVTPVIELKNLGDSIATSLDIMYQYDNQTPAIYNWTGNLGLFQQEDITLPTATLGYGFHDFKAWVVYPNDVNNANDTIIVNQFEIINGDGVQVQLLTDNYPDETSYHIIDENGVIIYSNANILDAQTLLTEDFCLSVGCYKFVVEDSFGDGLLYQGVAGTFSVYHNMAQVGIISGNFGSSDTIELCLNQTLVADFSMNAEYCINQNITPINNSNGISSSWSMPGANITSSTDNQPTFSYSTPGQYTITLTTTTTNGSTADTTLTITVNDGMMVNVDLNTDNNPLHTSYKVEDMQGNQVFFLNGFFNSNTLYQEVLCLPDDCYHLIINDIGGNGFSGNGGLTFTTPDSTYTAGQFTNSQSIFFCIGSAVDTDPLELLNGLNVYPNPTTGLMQFDTPKMPQAIRVFDIMGRTIQDIITPNSNQLDLTNYNTGVYIVQFEFEEGVITRKIVKQ